LTWQWWNEEVRMNKCLEIKNTHKAHTTQYNIPKETNIDTNTC